MKLYVTYNDTNSRPQRREIEVPEIDSAHANGILDTTQEAQAVVAAVDSFFSGPPASPVRQSVQIHYQNSQNDCFVNYENIAAYADHERSPLSPSCSAIPAPVSERTDRFIAQSGNYVLNLDLNRLNSNHDRITLGTVSVTNQIEFGDNIRVALIARQSNSRNDRGTHREDFNPEGGEDTLVFDIAPHTSITEEATVALGDNGNHIFSVGLPISIETDPAGRTNRFIAHNQFFTITSNPNVSAQLSGTEHRFPLATINTVQTVSDPSPIYVEMSYTNGTQHTVRRPLTTSAMTSGSYEDVYLTDREIPSGTHVVSIRLIRQVSTGEATREETILSETFPINIPIPSPEVTAAVVGSGYRNNHLILNVLSNRDAVGTLTVTRAGGRTEQIPVSFSRPYNSDYNAPIRYAVPVTGRDVTSMVMSVEGGHPVTLSIPPELQPLPEAPAAPAAPPAPQELPPVEADFWQRLAWGSSFSAMCSGQFGRYTLDWSAGLFGNSNPGLNGGTSGFLCSAGWWFGSDPVGAPREATVAPYIASQRINAAGYMGPFVSRTAFIADSDPRSSGEQTQVGLRVGGEIDISLVPHRVYIPIQLNADVALYTMASGFWNSASDGTNLNGRFSAASGIRFRPWGPTGVVLSIIGGASFSFSRGEMVYQRGTVPGQADSPTYPRYTLMSMDGTIGVQINHR